MGSSHCTIKARRWWHVKGGICLMEKDVCELAKKEEGMRECKEYKGDKRTPKDRKHQLILPTDQF